MTKTLHLLRHAKSSWDDRTLADHDRPLAPRGRRASRTIAAYLSSREITPGLVLCSSSVRTRETLAGISRGFDSTRATRVEFERGLYAVSAVELIARIRLVPDEVDSMMLIGHNPSIQDLALALAASGSGVQEMSEKFPTAALATLAIAGGWSNLEPGAARLVEFVKPRQLEEG